MPEEEVNENPDVILGKLNRTLDELLKFKSVLIATMDNSNERMDKIENKLQETKPDIALKEINVQIGKIEQTIEKMSNDIQHAGTKNTLTTEKLEKTEKKIDEISNLSKELDRKNKEDNKFMEATYMEIKEHIQSTNEALRENSKEIAKLDRKIESESRIINSFKNFIKAVIEQ